MVREHGVPLRGFPFSQTRLRVAPPSEMKGITVKRTWSYESRLLSRPVFRVAVYACAHSIPPLDSRAAVSPRFEHSFSGPENILTFQGKGEHARRDLRASVSYGRVKDLETFTPSIWSLFLRIRLPSFFLLNVSNPVKR